MRDDAYDRLYQRVLRVLLQDLDLQPHAGLHVLEIELFHVHLLRE
jgi:hypothetical protein